jgi:hypothetical protein
VASARAGRAMGHSQMQPVNLDFIVDGGASSGNDIRTE